MEAPGRRIKRLIEGGIRGQRLQTLAVTDPFELEDQAEPAVGNKGEWMRGIDRQWRQHRKDVRHELALEPGPIARVEAVRLDDQHARFVEQPP